MAKNMRPIPTISDEQEVRFWSKVDRLGPELCWPWKGPTSGNPTHKYGDFTLGRLQIRAHRISYTLAHGEVPAGLVIDHVCRNPLCVNPAHLEAVTAAENTLRGRSYPSHCSKGHPLAGDNLRMRGSGLQRACRACGAERQERYRQRKAAQNG